MNTFAKEADFEEALIDALKQKGWNDKGGVLRYPTEKDLIKNWADILFQNNNTIDRLNGHPMTDGEMSQIIEQINGLRTPLNLNAFINSGTKDGTISITRDNPDDPDHFGVEISLTIFNRAEIAGGQTRYQIVQQPKYNAKALYPDRRGDLMLLINGMPVIHIELKRSGVDVSQATNQIEKYAHEGVFTGLFSLVQVFVAMNPEETVYFANPGPDGAFNKNFFFHWADFYNQPINNWHEIAETLLSIPMAHQLIAYYTVADGTDGILKVMRSYQYYAASGISDKVAKIKYWDGKQQLGGHVWHTTGSGKTMTSFKAAQLIASSHDAHKVVFLMDRIELGTQSLSEYRNFAEATESVQGTEDTTVLFNKLKSSDASDTLIVTSIQKMSNIDDEYNRSKQKDWDIILKKHIVFIVDECHRSTFGDMMITIKKTFPNAVFFGFTGTPIRPENEKKGNTTTDLFGELIHKYTVANGIHDGNVLGFDPDMICTFEDDELRQAVALDELHKDPTDKTAVAEIMQSEEEKKVYDYYMYEVPMAGFEDENGKYIKGIEDMLPKTQYDTKNHRTAVISDIIKKWDKLSRGRKFHAILATSSIPEAIEYYRLFKSPELSNTLRIAALFEPTIDNDGGNKSIIKEDGIIEMLEDYNKMFDQHFSMRSYGLYKKDVSARLAHKGVYKDIKPEKCVDLLIVVDQMLTGFDSKWVNTLYLDKVLRYEGLIQAFSRTNRLFNGNDKPFGNIRYYRKPHTMKANIERAFDLYSGEKPDELFADKLPGNIAKMADIYQDIYTLFENAGIEDFEKNPADKSERAQFAKLWKQFNDVLAAARIQGFEWDTPYADENGEVYELPDENTYLILALRYKELFTGGGTGGGGPMDVPYEIDTHLTEIDTGRIDRDYMNSRYANYLRLLHDRKATPEELQKKLDDLHKTFATLTQEEQKYANIFLHDVQSGIIEPDSDISFRDYIAQYMVKAKNTEIRRCAELLGCDEEKLTERVNAHPTEKTLDYGNRYTELVQSVDRVKAKAFFEEKEGRTLTVIKVNNKIRTLLKNFILSGGFDIESCDDEE